MSNTQKDSKLVVVKTPGVLKELGFITGPIIHPSRIKLAKIVAMVNNGKKVFEVNPDNPDEQIELTRLNATSENFKKLPSAPEPEEKVERIADTKGKTAEVAGLGTLDRRVIDPTYTPAADTAAAVETAPVSTETKAEEGAFLGTPSGILPVHCSGEEARTPFICRTTSSRSESGFHLLERVVFLKLSTKVR